MLNKLLKYDMKAIGKSLLPFYGITLLSGLMVRLSGLLKKALPVTGFINSTITIVFVILVIAILFYTFYVSIKRFHQNALKDEGYLTHTLPTKRSNIVHSNLIASSIYFVASTAVLFLALILAIYERGMIKNIIDAINSLWALAEVNSGYGWLYFIITYVISYISYIVTFYLALVLGHNKTGNKTMYSVVFGLLIYGILQVSSFIPLGISLLIKPDLFTIMNSEAATFRDMAVMLNLSLIYSIIITIIMYIITFKFFKKHLNLD